VSDGVVAETDLLLWLSWTKACVIPLSPAAGFLIELARTIAIHMINAYVHENHAVFAQLTVDGAVVEMKAGRCGSALATPLSGGWPKQQTEPPAKATVRAVAQWHGDAQDEGWPSWRRKETPPRFGGRGSETTRGLAESMRPVDCPLVQLVAPAVQEGKSDEEQDAKPDAVRGQRPGQDVKYEYHLRTSCTRLSSLVHLTTIIERPQVRSQGNLPRNGWPLGTMGARTRVCTTERGRLGRGSRVRGVRWPTGMITISGSQLVRVKSLTS
jgi:hypothetical protein